jgi:hypothetical protein
MCHWKFTPYNLEKWNISNERILFVAAEPNGEQPNSGTPDMGDWFRTASPENNYHSNPQFFMRNVIMLNSINVKNTGQAYIKNNADFDNFRFMDLKATQGGGAQANQAIVLQYVQNNQNEVTKYFNSTDESFGLAPHIVVLLGNTAQSVFLKCIGKKLINNSNLQWIAMPHPSAQVGYDGLEYADMNIRQHLKPINQKTKKWVYKKDDFNNWQNLV